MDLPALRCGSGWVWRAQDGSRRVACSLAALSLALGASTASGETLADAIALAYQSNPSLQSARVQLRELDERYVQARAGFGPSAQIQVQASEGETPQTLPFFGTIDQLATTGSAAVSLTQPLYTGGRTTTDTRAALADIAAGRQELRGIEAQVLQKVIQAYEDVRRDEQILQFRDQQVRSLSDHLADAELRFKAGEITRTDVEQSDAELESARSDLQLAAGQLQVSRSAYAAVVGQNPGDLAPEPPLPGLPASVEEAFEIAGTMNPSLLQAQAAEHASSVRIERAQAEYRPSVSFSASYGYVSPLQTFHVGPDVLGYSVGVTVTQPLFTSGATRSKVREASEANTVDRINIEAARRGMAQAISQAWNQVIAARASAELGEKAVASAQSYVADTRSEYQIGQRSTLDVVYSEQSLTNARISLAQARHDAYVAESELLAAVGRLQADRLLVDAPLYDPKAAFNKVRNKGAAPWEGAVAIVDSLGVPGRGRARPIAAPSIDAAPQTPAGEAIPDDAPLATQVPKTPLPNTTSPKTPATVGALSNDPAGPPRPVAGTPAGAAP